MRFAGSPGGRPPAACEAPDLMDRHTLEVLDFPRIRSLLAEGARSPQGEDLCRSLEPAPSLEAAREILDELQDLALIEPVLGMPPTAGLERIETHLETARTEGTCLEVESFLAVRDSLATCHRVLEYLEDAAAEESTLGAYGARMRPLYPLSDRFERTFGPRGEILDGASPALLSLRAELRRLRGRILRTLEGVLRDAQLEPVVQEDFITLRNGRYVIPLRTDFRGYLKGIVHDRSRTGATFFVEPLEVVELNNQLDAVREQVDEEILRILRELTGWIGQEAGAIRANLAVAAHLDGLGARLVLARRLRAVRPVLVEDPVLAVREARHPLLEVHEGVAVVPVDLNLGGETRLLLVTGANAGGKTVALKTAGLLTAMARAGLFIPTAPDPRVGWFRDLFADIGDEQDIDRHLSTFSAHVEHLRDILEAADSGSLVLLDELGTGTDPREGVGLASAVLERLLDRGAVVIGTTHLDGLKVFAYARDEAQNAAVAFDPESGSPLYRLVYGQAGSSNALEVAERLGMPADVLTRAREYAAGGGEGTGALLPEIERAADAARRAEERAEALRREWEARVREQEAALEAARRERDAAKVGARSQVREVLEAARHDLRAAIRRFAEERASQQEAERALERVERQMEEQLRPEVPQSAGAVLPEVREGMPVRVLSLGRDGVIEGEASGGREVVVRVGNLRVTVPREDLRESGGESQSPEGRSTGLVRVQAERGAADLVVVGCTVHEALKRVDKALDRALLSGVDGFRVVHGRGTGALRTAIREHLAEAPHVVSVRSAAADAATWVEIG